MERLTIKAPSGLIHLADNKEHTQNLAIKKLSDYEDLEEQGLLVRVPVPLKSKVYSAECGTIVTDYANAFEFDEDRIWVKNSYGGIIGLWNSTVFATEQEAQAALEKMKGE